MDRATIKAIIAGTANDAMSSYGVNTGQWLSRLGAGSIGQQTQDFWKANMTPAGLAAMNAPPVSASGLNIPGIAMNYLADPVNALAPEIKYMGVPQTFKEAAKFGMGITVPRVSKLLKVPGNIADIVEAAHDQIKASR